ncbi:hypothetical protein FGF1_03800 [Flavobacteriaceae bacterium GF1]
MQNHLSMVRNSLSGLRKYATSGDIQPHEALMLIKESGLEDFFGEVLKDIKSASIENLRRSYLDHGEKTFKANGYSYTVKQGGTRYYFTDVEEVQDKKKQAENTEEFKVFKETEKKYKTAFLMKQRGHAMVDEDTGEIVDPINVKVTYLPDSISIKKLKEKVA